MFLIGCNRGHFLAYLPKGLTGCEIGVQNAKFSEVILSHSEPRTLHLIDPWEESEDDRYIKDSANVPQRKQDEIYSGVLERLDPHVRGGNVKIHRSTSESALKCFPDNSLDFAYIDGLHHHEGVYKDLEDCSRVVRNDGVIFGHDFSEHPHAAQADFGVITAVTTFCRRHSYQLLAVTYEHHASFMVAKRGERSIGHALLDHILHRTNHLAVEIPDNLASAFSQRIVMGGEGPKNRVIISFEVP